MASAASRNSPGPATAASVTRAITPWRGEEVGAFTRAVLPHPKRWSAAPAHHRRLDVHESERGGGPFDHASVEALDALVQVQKCLAQLALALRLQRAIQVEADLQRVGQEREVLLAELLLHPP